MAYGRPISTGHGRRTTRYRWSPSFDPASPRRKRRRAAMRKTAKRLVRPLLPSWNWEEAFATDLGGGRHPNWYVSLLGSVFLLALMVHFPVLFFFPLFRWITEVPDSFAEDAEESMLSSLDEATAALRIKRKTSVDAPPTPEEIRRAWEASRRSLGGKLLAGTLLSNLEPVVDQSYIRDADGTVVGRRPGIKGWLAANCPDMLPHYKALMNYKALADKLRLALGVEEPDTLSGVLDFGAETPNATDSGAEAAPESDGATTQKTGMALKTTGEAPKAAGTRPETAAKGTQKGAGRKGVSPKSLRIRNDIRLSRSNVENVIEKVNGINEAMERWGSAGSMAALEAAVRERLGLVWMRRGRRRGRAA